MKFKYIGKEDTAENIFTFKHYKSFRDLFEEWEEVECR